MQTSYGQLIREHDAIDDAAAALLRELADDGSGSGLLAHPLRLLAEVVEVDVEAEESIVADFDRGRFAGLRAATWQEDQGAFQHLRFDRLSFSLGGMLNP